MTDRNIPYPPQNEQMEAVIPNHFEVENQKLDKAKTQVFNFFLSYWEKYYQTKDAVKSREKEIALGLGKRPSEAPAKIFKTPEYVDPEQLPYASLFIGGKAIGNAEAESSNRNMIGYIADAYRNQNKRLPTQAELVELFAQNPDITASSPGFEETLSSYTPQQYTGQQ